MQRETFVADDVIAAKALIDLNKKNCKSNKIIKLNIYVCS